MPEYPGDEWRTKWHTLDIAQANSLLDKIGLDKKDASGMRLRADGKGVLRIEINTTNSFVNYSKIGRDDRAAVEEDRHHAWTSRTWSAPPGSRTATPTSSRSACGRTAAPS